MLIKVTKNKPVVDGNLLVMITAISPEREKPIKGTIRKVCDVTFKPVGVCKGYDDVIKEIVIPDDFFEGSVLHELLEATDPDFDIDAMDEYDSDNLLKKKLIIKIKKGKGKKREFANIVKFYPRSSKMSVVAFETDDTTSTKKRRKNN